MEAFQDKEEPTQPIDIEALQDEDLTLSRTTTRRRKSSYIGLVPLLDARCLPPGTEMHGPQGQRGYIAGTATEAGNVVFALVEGRGRERSECIVEMRPEAFSGWTTSGGVTL